MTHDDEVYAFDCPACGEAVEVDASMREALVSHGCVVCGARVSTRAFSPAASRAR
ncbi:DUF7560 family zinc ribbon protein [Candidatus Halobonum tyrrellensis]|uniref:Small CPxCG-related zinc finger protein n=1 Tax=Candidatus Halobonum tyrrellensis G22 TaxID=1324957 RepID=V4HPZ7_9EURY|nr:hypothetical protein [Candidatus Halobonum tyrrellensis]ESP89989.1 hypothetical protein K933_00462 [Candidatus Halobonum tyrrellensis G22]